MKGIISILVLLIASCVSGPTFQERNDLKLDNHFKDFFDQKDSTNYNSLIMHVVYIPIESNKLACIHLSRLIDYVYRVNYEKQYPDLNEFLQLAVQGKLLIKEKFMTGQSIGIFELDRSVLEEYRKIGFKLFLEKYANRLIKYKKEILVLKHPPVDAKTLSIGYLFFINGYIDERVSLDEEGGLIHISKLVNLLSSFSH